MSIKHFKRKSELAKYYFGELKAKEKIKKQVKEIKLEAPDYFVSFLPFITWIGKYNKKWLIGDLIAGLTVGIMIVPQSLAYAKLAGLPIVYGLYTSFMAAMVYSLLGTTREISVGPTAVLCLIVSGVINNLQDNGSEFSNVDIAIALAFFGGLITLVMGVLRLGIVLDLIPNPVILGFTNGSALTIILTQSASLLGIPNVKNNNPASKIIYDIFSNIKLLNWRDLLFGLSSLVFIKGLTFISKLLNEKNVWIRYMKISSNGLAVLIFTIFSFIAFKTQEDFNLKIVKEVPSGLNHIQLPNLSSKLIQGVFTELVPATLIGLLEHVALAKAFSRKSGYRASISQELFASGMGNFLASFFGAFPSSGSFSRSAVLSQSGVRTPLSGIWTGAVVLMSLGFLTPAFYYIPIPTLSAIIIASAFSLLSSYQVILDLWKVQPSDCIIFLVAVIATFFGGSEIGIASSTCLSFIILIYRIARPRLYLLNQVIGRDVYIDQYHPGYETTSPIPGVLIFKPQESLIFPNIDYIKGWLIDSVLEYTRSRALKIEKDEALWCDDLEERGFKLRQKKAKKTGIPAPDFNTLPYLKSVVFDFSSVNLIDSSGLQGLFDIRDMLSSYAGTDNCFSIESNNLLTKESMIQLEEAKTSDIRIPYNTFDKFEMHFVSTNPEILKVLELSGITSPIAPAIPRNVRKEIGTYSVRSSKEINTSYSKSLSRKTYSIEPIVSNASRFVHISVSDAIEKLAKKYNL